MSKLDLINLTKKNDKDLTVKDLLELVEKAKTVNKLNEIMKFIENAFSTKLNNPLIQNNEAYFVSADHFCINENKKPKDATYHINTEIAIELSDTYAIEISPVLDNGKFFIGVSTIRFNDRAGRYSQNYEAIQEENITIEESDSLVDIIDRTVNEVINQRAQILMDAGVSRKNSFKIAEEECRTQASEENAPSPK